MKIRADSRSAVPPRLTAYDKLVQSILRQFEKIKKQLVEYINENNQFEFEILEEMMNDAKNLSGKRSQAAHKRWDKTEETGMH